MRTSAFGAVLAFAFVAAATVGAKFERSQAPGRASVLIPLPAEWVPFQADVFNRHHDHESSGTVSRRRDGSVAWVLQTPGGTVITIHNVRTGRTYGKLGDKGWHSRPILEAIGLPPRELPFSGTVRMVADPVIGDVVELGSATLGPLTQYAVRLNGFPIRKVRENGAGQEVTNIRFIDPPDDLFLPPEGVPIKVLDK
jgi:hypothetical protein